MNSATSIAMAVCAKYADYENITVIESFLITECDMALTYHRSIREDLVPIMAEKAENRLLQIMAG